MREIERKFLVRDDSFISQAVSSERIAQGYLCARRVTARVRIYGDKAFLTFKGKSKDGGLSRFEFERQIPLGCGESLLARCNSVVEKRLCASSSANIIPERGEPVAIAKPEQAPPVIR